MVCGKASEYTVVWSGVIPIFKEDNEVIKTLFKEEKVINMVF